MDTHRKVQILALLSAACVMLIVLAASVGHVEFQAGRTFSLGQIAAVGAERFGARGSAEILLLVLRGAGLLALALLPIFIIVGLLTREGRFHLVSTVVAILGLLFLLNRVALSPVEPLPLETEPEPPGEMPLEAPPSGPTDQFVARVPPWSEDLAVVVLAVLISGGAAASLWWLTKRRQPAAPPMDRLAQGAQDGIDALRAGESVQDAVIRSYLQMSQVLREERGIERDKAMTPHEFEALLAQLGFPPEPVQELTRLFEEARYGSQLSGEREEQRAIASLQAILTYCRAAGGGL